MAGLKRSDVPRLKGWLTFHETAALLGVTSAAVDFQVFQSGQFGLDDIRQVGHGRPTYLLRESAVKAAVAARVAAAERAKLSSERTRQIADRMQIREWAWANGFEFSQFAPLKQEIIDAYQKAHPSE